MQFPFFMFSKIPLFKLKEWVKMIIGLTQSFEFRKVRRQHEGRQTEQ